MTLYMEEMRRNKDENMRQMRDIKHVQKDVSSTPCSGHLLPWLCASCIRCGQLIEKANHHG